MKFTKEELRKIHRICDAIKVKDWEVVFKNIELNAARKKVEEFYKIKEVKSSNLVEFNSNSGAALAEYDIPSKTLYIFH